MAVKIANIKKERTDSVWRLVELTEPFFLKLRIMLIDGECEVLKPGESSFTNVH